MEPESKAVPPNDQTPSEPVQHVAGAYQLLKALGDKLGWREP